MTPVCAVGAFIFDTSDRILVIQRGRPPGEGLWSVPGGKLEAAETLAHHYALTDRKDLAFTYLDQDNNVTATAGNIRTVTITITTQQSAGQPSVTMVNRVRLRNRPTA